MEEKTVQELSALNEAGGNDSEAGTGNQHSGELFQGLNLAEMAKAMKMPLPPRVSRVVETTQPLHAENSEIPVVNERVAGPFAGLDLVGMAAAFKAARPIVRGRSLSPDAITSTEPRSKDESTIRIATSDVVASLFNLKRSKRVKISTLKTYEKRLRHF
jgi:hypothetical protein